MLNELFPVQSEIKIFTAAGSVPRRKYNAQYNIYPLSAFAQLVEYVAGIESAKKNTFRFLIDKEGILWFAQEGPANNRIPAHYQLTGLKRYQAQCMTAGNIHFEKSGCDAKGKLILKVISNKSGDFRCDFKSLKPLLIILAKTENLPFTIADTIVLEELNAAGGIDKEHQIDKDKLKEIEVEECFSTIIDKQAKAVKKQVDYTIESNSCVASSEAGVSSSSRRGGVSFRTLFGDASGDTANSSPVAPTQRSLFESPPASPQKRAATDLIDDERESKRPR